MVPPLSLLEKLRKHGIGGKLLRTVGNWLCKNDSEFVLMLLSLRCRKCGVGFRRALSWSHCYF